MSLRRLLTQTCTVTPRSGGYDSDRDVFGTPVEAPGEPVEYPCMVADDEGQEALDGGVIVSFSRRVILPPEVVVDATDRIEVEGEFYEVLGPPLVARRHGLVHHVEARVRRVE
jgi:hypothetical protein